MTRLAPRVLLAFLIALGIVGTAFGSTPQRGKAKEGTFIVTEGAGLVTMTARGSVLVQVSGTIRVRDLDQSEGAGPVFVGCTAHDVSEDTADGSDQVLVCSGDAVRLRILKEAFRLRVSGKGLYVSAIGSGNGTLKADLAVADPGTYTIDDAAPLDLPSLLTKYKFGRGAAPSAVNVAS